MVRGTRTVLPSPSATWLQPTAGGGGGREAGKPRRRMRVWRAHGSALPRGWLGNQDDACVLGEHMTPPHREGDWETTVTHAFLENQPRARRWPASRVTASGVPWSPRMKKCADLEEVDGQCCRARWDLRTYAPFMASAVGLHLASFSCPGFAELGKRNCASAASFFRDLPWGGRGSFDES